MKYIYKIMVLITAFQAVLFTAGLSFAQWGSRQGSGPGYMHSPWGNMMGGWGWMGMVFNLLILILIVAALIMAIRWVLQGGRSREGNDTRQGSSGRAMEVLKERYARGEIDKDEFEQKKKDLS